MNTTKNITNEVRAEKISTVVTELQTLNKIDSITIEIAERKSEKFAKVKNNNSIVACIYFAKNRFNLFASTDCDSIEFTFYEQNSARPKYRSNTDYTDSKSINKDLQLIIKRVIAENENKQKQKQEKAEQKKASTEKKQSETKTDKKQTQKAQKTDKKTTTNK